MSSARKQDVDHRVIGWDEVDAAEGTGIVHIAPGAGKEDFALSKQHDLAVIAPIDEFGVYGEGFGALTGQYVHEVAVTIAEDLEQKGLLYRAEQYRHRYPVCWRCSTDLVFRLVDEWFIAMDDLRQPMMDVTRQIDLASELRSGSRARLAGAHGRLDDLQEALLGTGASHL